MGSVRAPWAVALLAGGMLARVVPVPFAVGVQDGVDSPASSHRVVHRFDFDEHDEGNLEEVPMFWGEFRANGFPRFARGAFDDDVGRLATPSFHLASEGRNVAYHYTGPDTRVRANTDYRIEGFIKADGLTRARACLSAHFLDRRGNVIPKTLVRSVYLGGSDGPEGWVKVDLFLSSAPEEAYTIGLHAWVLQEASWNADTPLRRHIVRRDVSGGAWFDDISIYALPRVELSIGAAGNVLPPDGSQTVNVLLADHDDATLEGHLEVTARNGAVLATQTIAVSIGNDPEPVSVPVGHLPPGLYHAHLEVVAGETPIVSRTLTFALLAPLVRKEAALARPFGVVLNPRSRSDPATELALLRNQAVRSVKLPVWTGLAEEPPGPAQRRAADHLLQELARSSFSLTGVLCGPPSAIVRADGPYPRTLTALLNEPASVWQEHLAAVAAPYASVFHWWQVGPDDDDGMPAPLQHAAAINNLREAMRRFIAVPLLSAPSSAAVEPPDEKLPAEQLSLTLGRELRADWLASQVERFDAISYDHLAAYIQPLGVDTYESEARLADWAQRIIEARHGGADSVFVPQTWRVRATAQGRVTEPTEEYLILRTIADVLADAMPGERVPIAPGVQCLAFHNGETTVLAIWDRQAPPEGTRYPIQLGLADRQIDLWGRVKPLERGEDGRQIVRLSPTPILIDGVQRWLIDLRTSLVLLPQEVETGVESVDHTLSMVHGGAQPISGRLQLDVPESWDLTPRSFGFNLTPKREDVFAIRILYPHNAAAGVKDVVAKIALTESAYYLEVPLSIELGLSDVEVRGMAVVEGKDLILRHVVTNRSAEALSFRGSANVPGRQPQYRSFADLRPGDTQTVKYRVSGGPSLVGSRVRLGLLELNDGPRRHNLELIVP